MVEHPVVVVAARVAQLVEPAAQPPPDPAEVAEVQRRTGDGGDLTRRDERRVHRRVVRGIQPQLVILDRARALAREVPVRVRRQRHHGRCVRRGEVVQPEPVALAVERVRHVDGQRAGEALVTVRARVREAHADAVICLEALRGPDRAVEPALSSVQTVRRIVARQLELEAVEDEPGAGDAVAVAADDAAHVRVGSLVGRVRVPVQVLEAEDHVVPPAPPVGQRGRTAVSRRR